MTRPRLMGTLAAVAVCMLQARSLAPRIAAQSVGAVTSFNWTLHNYDLFGSRYVPLTQITRDNVKALVPRWIFQHGVIDGVSNQTTPIIVDGTMYPTDSHGSVYAVNAADGHFLWSYDVTDLIGGGAREGYIFRQRGVCYMDGVVYTAGGASLFALDAKTGKPIQGFGTHGQANPILEVLKQRYPNVASPISMGYSFTCRPPVLQGRAVRRGKSQREPRAGRVHVQGRCEDREGALGVQHRPAG